MVCSRLSAMRLRVCVRLLACRPRKWVAEISHGVNYSHQISIKFHCWAHSDIFALQSDIPISVVFLLRSWICSPGWLVQVKRQKSRWKSEELRKNMFVVHAISDYYILFSFLCTSLSSFLPFFLIATEKRNYRRL